MKTLMDKESWNIIQSKKIESKGKIRHTEWERAKNVLFDKCVYSIYNRNAKYQNSMNDRYL